MWIEREILPTIKDAAATRPALILTGCRQAGKTSALRRAFPGARYVTLDLPAVADRAEHSGQQFLADHPPPVILDEVQYAPDLLRHVKADIDAHRSDNGRFLLTGSQKFQFMQGVSESLAGRVAVIDLHSLSFREVVRHAEADGSPTDLLRFMVAGGYPELHAAGLDPVRFYSDYLVTYLERDVRSVLNVRSLRDFDRLLRLCASRTGQLLSMNQFATDVGVSTNTIKSWLSVLQASGIVFLLEPYFENLGKRIVKTPKLYLLDTGLACFLAGLRTPAELRKSSLLGAMFETHVLGQLVRHFANRGVQPALYFYRDHYGHEVDFVIARGGRLQLIETKWSERPSPAQPGFEELIKLAGEERIVSRTVVSPNRGNAALAGGVAIADSIELAFLE